jgi:hypothetical protein
MKYWYNVNSKVVEDDEHRSPSAELLGPFSTYDQAADALTVAEQRNRQSDDSDAEWNDEDRVDS